ncbi:hypothetical protein OF83DRAFT_58301, partial [Amylostereum chailletii]
MNEALDRFHENKDIFIELGIRTDFNLPKLHACRHYSSSIELFGTTDNYNTEQSERLHIDFAKDAYRATNRRDEYPQMTTWLERREKVQHHAAFVEWQLAGCPDPDVSVDAADHARVQMTKHPTLPAVHFDTLSNDYGAVDFADALADFLTQHAHPHLSAAAARTRANNLLIPTSKVPVYHGIKLWNDHGLHRPGQVQDTCEKVHVRPARKDTRGRPVPARFDMVLVKVGSNQSSGISGFRVAQVHVVFHLPRKALSHIFLSNDVAPPPKHLAYIEWFSPFTEPESDSLMYRVSRSVRQG